MNNPSILMNKQRKEACFNEKDANSNLTSTSQIYLKAKESLERLKKTIDEL